MTPSAFDFSATTIDGSRISLDRYRGHALLVVNVASHCGYTPQYAALEDLYRRYGGKGLVVLGFPCDQFGHQEPGTEADIRQFCERRYGVTFPLFEKVLVNGPGAHPLFEFLKARRPGLLGSQSIKWNFTKFLVGRSGQVVGRYGPRQDPASIEPDISRVLEVGPP